MKIIGLGHYSRSGKDSLANFIVSQSEILFDNVIKVKKISLAWKLKKICHDLYSWAGIREPEWYDTVEGEGDRDVVLPALGMTPVQVWVAFGTPAVRERVYDRTWIDYVLKIDHECDLLVVPDIRFPNEIDAFREEGATMVKVVREGYGPRDTVADQALVGFGGWDYIAGVTMEDLKQNAFELLHWAIYGEAFPEQLPCIRDMLLKLEKK